MFAFLGALNLQGEWLGHRVSLRSDHSAASMSCLRVATGVHSCQHQKPTLADLREKELAERPRSRSQNHGEDLRNGLRKRRGARRAPRAGTRSKPPRGTGVRRATFQSCCVPAVTAGTASGQLLPPSPNTAFWLLLPEKQNASVPASLSPESPIRSLLCAQLIGQAQVTRPGRSSKEAPKKRCIMEAFPTRGID